MSEILTAPEIEQLARFDEHWRVTLAGDNRLLAQPWRSVAISTC